MADCADAPEEPAADAGTRTEVVGAEKLIALLQQRAQAAVDAGSTAPTLAVRTGPPRLNSAGSQAPLCSSPCTTREAVRRYSRQ